MAKSNKHSKGSKNKISKREIEKFKWLSKLILIVIVIQLFIAIISAQNTEIQKTILKIHGYARVIAAVGFSFIIFYSGYKFYFSESELERKEAWTTLSYGVIGALLVLVAPELGNFIAGDKALFSSDPQCTI